MTPLPPRSTLFPYTTLFRSCVSVAASWRAGTRSPVHRQGFSVLRVNSEDSARVQCRTSSANKGRWSEPRRLPRSEEHTSELQSRRDLVCRLLLEKKKKKKHILMQMKTKKADIKHMRSTRTTQLRMVLPGNLTIHDTADTAMSLGVSSMLH